MPASARACRRATSSATSGAAPAADTPGSRNLIGIKDPVVDELIDKIITAAAREDLIAACRALDRVLLWGHYVHPALAQPGHPHRLLGQVRPSGDLAALRRRPVRLVGRPGEAADDRQGPRRSSAPCRQLRRRRCWPIIVRRLLLVIPTLFGIMVINFVDHPGGARRAGRADDLRAVGPRRRRHRARHRRRQRGDGPAAAASRRAADAGRYRGAQGLDPAFIARARAAVRLRQAGLASASSIMVRQLSALRFRRRASSATARWLDLVVDKMPVSISLGLWTTLLTYLISIPLGIRKAVRDGTRFDVWTSGVIIVGNAIPGFLFAVLLIVLFAGGSYCVVPAARPGLGQLRVSCPGARKVLDYLWHMALPVMALVIGGFAALTMLTKNSLPRRDQQAVRADRARQGPERAPRAVRPRLPQRHADRHRGLSRPRSSASCSPARC